MSMDKEARESEASSSTLPEKGENSETTNEKDTKNEVDGQPRKWYPGKYMGLKKKSPNSKSSEHLPDHEHEEIRDSISTDRPSEMERRSSLSRQSTGSNPGKSGWYPGKYMGMRDRRKSNASEEADAMDNIMDTGEEPAKGQTTWSTYGGDPTEDPKSKRSISTWLSSFSRHDAENLRDEQNPEGGAEDSQQQQQRSHSTGHFSNWFRRSSGSPTDASNSKDLAAEDPEAEKEETRKEAMITRTVRCIRNKFIDRQLHGRILIYRTSGVVTTAVLCEVNAMEIKSAEVTAEEIASLSYNDRRAITMTDTVLNSLERRSRAWDGCDFAQEVFLTRGMFIGVSDPFVGMIGFSIQVDFTCTIKSLLASRKRFEAKVRAEKEMAAMMQGGDERGSFFSRSFSFSMTGNRDTSNSSISNTVGGHHTTGLIDNPPPNAHAFDQPIQPVVKVETSERFGGDDGDEEEVDESGVKEV